MKLEVYRQNFDKSSSTIFHENSSIKSRFVLCGQTDRHKNGLANISYLIIPFCSFENTPKNTTFWKCYRLRQTVISGVC